MVHGNHLLHRSAQHSKASEPPQPPQASQSQQSLESSQLPQTPDDSVRSNELARSNDPAPSGNPAPSNDPAPSGNPASSNDSARSAAPVVASMAAPVVDAPGVAHVVDGRPVFQSFAGLMKPVPQRKAVFLMRGIEVVRSIAIILAIIMALWTPVMHARSARDEALRSQQAAAQMAKWPRGKAVKAYNAAKAYNRKIAASGQTTLGETPDPFSGSGPQEKTISESDKEYQSLLRGNDGIMGTVRVPKVSLRLPIYHGTSKTVLKNGAGHLYGTSVPVGGKSTNTVLTGHRGLPDALLFTRLDELKKGDVIYVQTLGRTMGYRVTAIHVVDPEDVHLYKVVNGKDLLTLMTCTPYGVNTHRLVITAKRGRIPQDIPKYDGSHDAVLYGILAFGAVLLLGVALLLLGRYKSLLPPPWHDDGSARRKAYASHPLLL